MGESVPEEFQAPFVNGMALKAIALINLVDWHTVATMESIERTGVKVLELEYVAKKLGIKITKKLFLVIKEVEREILKQWSEKDGGS